MGRRLGFDSPDDVQVSLVRYGPHMLPIFERPALVSTLVHAHSRGLQVPVFWQVSEGAYSLVRSWSAFDFSSEFLLLTTTGRRMLYLEADTTNSEASLTLSAKASDLTMEDASQAFLLIRRAARHWRRSTAHTKPFRGPHVSLGAGQPAPGREHDLPPPVTLSIQPAALCIRPATVCTRPATLYSQVERTAPEAARCVNASTR